MSTRSARAMKVLSRLGELAWFSLPSEKHPVYRYPQVPYMGWRYTSAEEDTAHPIEEVVGALSTKVEWTLDRTRKSWLLVPTRILREAKILVEEEGPWISPRIPQPGLSRRRAATTFLKLCDPCGESSRPETFCLDGLRSPHVAPCDSSGSGSRLRLQPATKGWHRGGAGRIWGTPSQEQKELA